ncbi:MAG: apolipoprotein N-acyltransferase, partial [Planctomycetota bacterium]
VGFAWLAWIAPVPLLWISMDSKPWMPNNSADRGFLKYRPYRQIYLAGLIYWLGLFYFIPIPHPALWIGWILVSSYLALYSPIFVAACRGLHQNFRLPLLVVVPVCWTGIELIRSYFATGMALVCLSHTQYRSPILIQVADLFGGYTLTFLMVLTACGIAILTASLAKSFFKIQPPALTISSRALTSLVTILAFSFVLVYGQFRLSEDVELGEEQVELALIQTSHDVIFGRMTDDRIRVEYENKYRLTNQALNDNPELDLIVWPESALIPYTDLLTDFNAQNTVRLAQQNIKRVFADMTQSKPGQKPMMMVGAGTLDPDSDASYASVLLLSEFGEIKGRYFKNHLIMVGEYIPFLDTVFPFAKDWIRLPSTTAGTKFESYEVAGLQFAPNLCFESTLPQLIRRQLNQLAAEQGEPDAMVNLTNDGWFYGTSCLDLHLACNVFRAVEMRKPNLVCANTGFSAEIDTCGRLVQLGPRRAEAILPIKFRSQFRSSLYRSWGDTIPAILAVVTMIGWFTSLRRI